MHLMGTFLVFIKLRNSQVRSTIPIFKSMKLHHFFPVHSSTMIFQCFWLISNLVPSNYCNLQQVQIYSLARLLGFLCLAHLHDILLLSFGFTTIFAGMHQTMRDFPTKVLHNTSHHVFVQMPKQATQNVNTHFHTNCCSHKRKFASSNELASKNETL